MNLDLTDDGTAALILELDRIIEDDRYPLSPRIMTLKAILVKLRPEPIREPLPPIKRYDPPRAGRYRRSGEVSTRPADDTRKRGGCPCALDRVVPPLRGATRLCRVPGMPPSGRTRYGVTSCRQRWHKCRRNGETMWPRDSRSRLARAKARDPRCGPHQWNHYRTSQ
jgi:hypothetical protein